jgi:hypothetical protein
VLYIYLQASADDVRDRSEQKTVGKGGRKRGPEKFARVDLALLACPAWRRRRVDDLAKFVAVF